MSLDGTLDVSVGADAVTFTFTVENTGGQDQDLQFSDAQTFDIFVESDGETVWQWAEGRMFAQMLSTETLPAGASESFETTWDDPSPGDYEARAVLTANNADCEATASFSV
ncbi:hypothetical protein BRD00_09070 [Halobacteriales archaeon QS_8_69_26]|nr:MAG: hypothetical protein BRD00_09070 [Halobacteriales archaeon QS_8_69_26]